MRHHSFILFVKFCFAIMAKIFPREKKYNEFANLGNNEKVPERVRSVRILVCFL